MLIVAVIGFGVSVQDQQTCNQTGTFTVLDNQYFSIIAEAEPIPSVQVRARVHLGSRWSPVEAP